MSEKRRLGKGLGALIPEALAVSGESNEIALEKIKPNPLQPRREFDEGKLRELADSIKEIGVLQAVIVTPGDDEYFLVAGERRWRAARMAGLKTIPAVVRHFEQSALLEIALIENLQREDLNPVEEAQAYRKLMQDYGYTQEELAGKLGRSRPSIANSVRLLSLPEELQSALAAGNISPGQARPLLAVEDPSRRGELAERIINEKISAREVERIVQRGGAGPANPKTNQRSASHDPLKDELQDQIQRSLGTRVNIKPGRTGGTIEIFYYGEDDLERLVARLLPEGI